VSVDLDELEALAKEHISCSKTHMIVRADAVLELVTRLRGEGVPGRCVCCGAIDCVCFSWCKK
jgi:hypothetical protein